MDVNASHRLGVHGLRGNRAPGLAELLAYGSLRTTTERSGGSGFGLGNQPHGGIPMGEILRSASRVDRRCGGVRQRHSELHDARAEWGRKREGFPIQLHQATRASLWGADLNAVWVPRWAAMWSMHTALSVVRQRRRREERLGHPRHRKVGIEAVLVQREAGVQLASLVWRRQGMRSCCTQAPHGVWASGPP